jgi:endonuclease G
MENYQGYQADFMGEGVEVPLPELAAAKQTDLAPELPYTHFSVFLSRSRRFPYFTATNVNGQLAWQIPREQVFPGGADRWVVDDRCPGFQWGQLLYSAPQSDFQRGHMTKREDPQWGSTEEIARRAAQDTFKFSNCVPQVKSLNTKAWGQLEMYILRKKAIPDRKLVNIFTGPVLADDDPDFIQKVLSQRVQLPTLFWKVVYYTNDGHRLNRAAFMMGQQQALLDANIVRPRFLKLWERFNLRRQQQDYFGQYKDAALYQVSVGFVEELTGLRFPEAEEVHQDDRAREVVMRQIQVPLQERHELANMLPDASEPVYEFDNLSL